MQITPQEMQIIKEVHHYIKANFKTHIPIKDLLAIYRISEGSLTKGFKQVFHKTIYQHRLTTCMEYAKIRIEEGDQIKCIRQELGYATHGSFSRAYKKIFPHQLKKPNR